MVSAVWRCTYSQLAPKILKIHAVVDAGDVEEHLIDTVLLHARRQRLKATHDPF
jgi:hypothetical protein